MPYDNITSRSDVLSLIPLEVSRLLLENLQTESAAMALFRHLPMGTTQTRMPVLSALPTAYWVQGDTGLKQTTEMAWANKYINAEEIAAIVPIPENVIDDVGFPIWDTVRPLVEQAIARVFDAAVFFGLNKPASFPEAIVTQAVSAGNSVTIGTADAAHGSLAGDISNLTGLIEAGGFMPDGAIARVSMRAAARNARNTLGVRNEDITPNDWWGFPVKYPMPGLWPVSAGTVQAVVGDFTEGIIGVRQDISWKLLDQAVIQGPDGAILYNLAQQDMVAMRVTCRFGFQVANIINYEQLDETLRFPFGVLLHA